MRTDSWQNVLSIILSVITLIFLFWYPIKLTQIILNADLDNKSFMEQYGSIFEIYKNKECAIFAVYMLVRKIFFALSLVLFNENP